MEGRSLKFRKYAWLVLVYTLLVILWGAYVRATGSGAGCGGHWPLCNGQVVPRSPAAETVIEYTHRLMSGLSLILVGGLVFQAFRAFPRGHRARLFAALSGLVLVVEALLGAGLIWLGFVADNASTGRAFYMSAHLTNTLLLLGVIALAAWSAREAVPPLKFRGKPKLLLAAAPVALTVYVTGALAALGDTLYPAASVAAGIRQEMADSAGVLLRLRMLHPAVALVVGAFLLMTALTALKARPTPQVRRHAMGVMGMVFVQLIAGAVNIALLAPVWMQIVHLLLADLLWIAMVILLAEVFAERPSLKHQLAREG
jgi:heme A synthase